MTTSKRPLVPAALLVSVTAIWGWTFVVVRDAVAKYPVVSFLSLRFGLAALVLAFLTRWRGTGFKQGLIPGLVLAVAYFFQTTGLQHTSASRAGLLTGLFVIFTPILEFAAYHRRPRRGTLAAILAAVVGTALLTGGFSLTSGEALGDALEVLTALALAVHILLLSRLPAGINSARAALSQMIVVGTLFTVVAAPSHGYPPLSASVSMAIVVTAVLASAAGFWVQTYAQQRIAPTRTALILAMEPAFATLFGTLLNHDSFKPLQALGAALILVGLVAHEAVPVGSSPTLSKSGEL